MTEGMGEGSSVLAAGALLEPAEVAEAVMQGLADGRFLTLPHPEVAEFERRRAADRDRWLAGMHRLTLTRRCRVPRWGSVADRRAGGGGCPQGHQMGKRPARTSAGRSLSGGRRYTSRLASFGLSERPRPDLSGQSRPLCPGDCWTCSTAGEPPLESGDLPELLNALVANSTTASPASTVATRMARQGRHPVRAVVTGSSGKRASFSRRP
jgi:hypothetical protein